MEYGHIFAYFITRLGTYTQEELISWKQLEAYNYLDIIIMHAAQLTENIPSY